MLLRITRPLSGEVDGIDLTQFESGSVYSVTVSIAAFLVALGAAEPVEDSLEHHILPPSKRLFHENRVAAPAIPRVWLGPERRTSPRR